MAELGPTAEQSLARAVLPLGPLIAIGSPGEVLPPMGAARLYVDDDHWQGVVEQLIAISPLVILRIGSYYDQSFWWEFKHVLATCEPERVLLFLHPGDSEYVYRAFRKDAKIASIDLPPLTRNALFVAFGPGWQPFFVGVPKGIVDEPLFSFGKKTFDALTPFLSFGKRLSKNQLRDALATLPTIYTIWGRRIAFAHEHPVPKTPGFDAGTPVHFGLIEELLDLTFVDALLWCFGIGLIILSFILWAVNLGHSHY
jgi:hypothetical protein